jgi:hypothetical protein
MRPELVRATRSAFERGISDDAAAAMLDFVASFPSVERARELTAAISELPRDWLESRIVEGGILDATAAVAVLAEAYVAAGRAEMAAAELLAFLETLAAVLGRLTRELEAGHIVELDAEADAIRGACPWRLRGPGGPRGAEKTWSGSASSDAA